MTKLLALRESYTSLTSSLRSDRCSRGATIRSRTSSPVVIPPVVARKLIATAIERKGNPHSLGSRSRSGLGTNEDWVFIDDKQQAVDLHNQ